jgi:16S rRNA (guanine1516-N2)-methyltransferase
VPAKKHRRRIIDVTRVEVCCAAPDRIEEAQSLADQLGVPLSDSCDAQAYLLTLTDARIELRAPQELGFSPLYVSFNEGHAAHRLRFGGGRGQAIARACGLKGGNTPSVFDLTAGLGRDAFVLASLGCRVTMIERNPVIALLLEDGLRRASEDSDIGQWVSERLSLVRSSAEQWLDQTDETPDVIYLDPMFPERKKSAQVKKEMRIFHDIIGEDEDADDLLNLAMGMARQRVVVKRPRHAPPLAGRKAPVHIEGKSTRFDVYPVT